MKLQLFNCVYKTCVFNMLGIKGTFCCVCVLNCNDISTGLGYPNSIPGAMYQLAISKSFVNDVRLENSGICHMSFAHRTRGTHIC